MGRRKSGEAPRVTVVGKSLNARVRIGGRAYWLGRCPDGKVTPEQTARAARLWNEYLSGLTPSLADQVPAAPATATAPAAPAPSPAAAIEPAPGITVAAIGLRYLDHCESYYRTPDGNTTSSVAGVEMALRALFPFSDTPAAKFGPRTLKTVREALVREGRPRVTCNRVAKTIRRMFKWAASEELVSPEVWHGLEALSPLQKGRTDAPELPPVEEVPEEVVLATLPYLPKVVADMVWLQRWTGARPGEVCDLRPGDVDRSGDVWVYTPESHKLSWREDAPARRIAIGAEGQRVLMPYLLRSATAHCFSPRDSEHDRNKARRLARRSPMTPSQRARKPARCRRRPAGERYTTASYRRAITRAVGLANKAAEKAGSEKRLPNWSPNQLRHLRAGEVKERFGIEASSAVLGHANIRTTEIYADRKLKIAADVTRQIG
jgi:integrase